MGEPTMIDHEAAMEEPKMIEGGLSVSKEAPAWSEDTPETSLLSPDTQVVEHSGSPFFFHRCTSRVAVLVLNILSVVLYISGFVAALVSGNISVSGQNDVAMVFNILFTVLIFYGAFKSNWTVVLVGLLWSLFVVVFGIVGAKTAFDRTDWSQEPAGTQRGTEAFIVISLIWQFLVIYAEVVFVYEMKNMTEAVFEPEAGVERVDEPSGMGVKADVV